MQVAEQYQQTPTANGFYVTAWKQMDGEWDFGIFVELIDGEFYDEDGDQLESIFDPVLQIRCSPGAADAYIPQ